MFESDKGKEFVYIKVPCIKQDNRLVRYYEYDNEPDYNCCVHGIKLRWTCDECNEYFESDSPCQSKLN